MLKDESWKKALVQILITMENFPVGDKRITDGTLMKKNVKLRLKNLMKRIIIEEIEIIMKSVIAIEIETTTGLQRIMGGTGIEVGRITEGTMTEMAEKVIDHISITAVPILIEIGRLILGTIIKIYVLHLKVVYFYILLCSVLNASIARVFSFDLFR